MILAAGLGKRLRPLTDQVPKPLLQAGGKTLIEHQLENIRAAGITEVVINTHHLSGQFEPLLGNGAQYGVSIAYSHERELLETGGGIKRALSLLGDEPFLVVSADTYIEFDFRKLLKDLPVGIEGRLLMTVNPPHHPRGDFALENNGVLMLSGDKHSGSMLTYTGIGVMSAALITRGSETRFALRRVFDESIAAGCMQGLAHHGYWCDVGTQDRLAQLRLRLGG